MSVKLRLMRVGKKKQPTYRIVAADSRSPRDGRFIEIVGTYAPRCEPSEINVRNEKVLEWLQKGAQPTETVRKLFEISGVWSEFQASHPAKPKKDRTRPDRTRPAPKGRVAAPGAKAPAAKAGAAKAAAAKAGVAKGEAAKAGASKKAVAKAPAAKAAGTRAATKAAAATTSAGAADDTAGGDAPAEA